MIDRSLPGLTLTFLLLQLKIQNSTFSSHTEFGKQYRVVVSNKQCCGWEQEEEREAQGSRDKEWGERRNLDSSALLDRSWVHSAHLWQHPPPEAIFQSWADAQSSGFSLLPSTKFGKNLMKRLCIRCFLVFFSTWRTLSHIRTHFSSLRWIYTETIQEMNLNRLKIHHYSDHQMPIAIFSN